MTLTSIATLFISMVVLAAVPSISVITVITRSVSNGFIHGAMIACGIVIGDLVYIAIAIFGLSVLADALGDMFVVIKYLGGAYLLWLGLSLWRTRFKTATATGIAELSLFSSFIAGLLITLGDQKAILFYLGFFPAFIDLDTLSQADVGLIVGITILAVGGTKLAYAYMAAKAGRLLANARLMSAINRLAGAVMIAIGIVVITRT
jgi:threonine/homoserine/homoserine lactone efflux protein